MVVIGAVFFAGIAGGTLGQDSGVLPIVDLCLLVPGLRQIECHILTSHEAITGITGLADGGIEV